MIAYHIPRTFVHADHSFFLLSTSVDKFRWLEIRWIWKQRPSPFTFFSSFHVPSYVDVHLNNSIDSAAYTTNNEISRRLDVRRVSPFLGFLISATYRMLDETTRKLFLTLNFKTCTWTRATNVRGIVSLIIKIYSGVSDTTCRTQRPRPELRY